MDRIQFTKPDVDTIPVIKFVLSHAADIAEVTRIGGQIVRDEKLLAETRMAPRGVDEAVEIVETEARKAAEEVDAWILRILFSACRRVHPPYNHFDDKAGRIILALASDRIKALGGSVVQADDAVDRKTREKKIAELSKAVDKNKARIAKLLDGQDEQAVFGVVNKWRDIQSMVSTPVDMFGTQLNSQNPFFDAYTSLNIGTAVAREGHARYEANLWGRVDYFYAPFL